jgi:hypothetical protein
MLHVCFLMLSIPSFRLLRVYIQLIIIFFGFLVGTVLSYVFYWLAVIVVLVYTKYKEVNKYLFTHLSPPLNSFSIFPRAELKFSDTNPTLEFASGNAKKKKISESPTHLTTAKRPQKKRTFKLPLLQINIPTSMFFLADHNSI